jgi:hypothetical protein
MTKNQSSGPISECNKLFRKSIKTMADGKLLRKSFKKISGA